MNAKTKCQGCREAASLLSCQWECRRSIQSQKTIEAITPQNTKNKQTRKNKKKSTNKKVKNMNWNVTRSKNCCDEKDAIKKDGKQLPEWQKPLANQIYQSLHPECTKKPCNSIIKGNPIKNWQEN